MGNVGVREAATWLQDHAMLIIVCVSFVTVFTIAFAELTGIADKYASKTAIRKAYIDPTNGQCYMYQGTKLIPCPVPATSK